MSNSALAEDVPPKDMTLRNSHLPNLADLFASNYGMPSPKELLTDHIPITGTQRDDKSVFELLGKVAEMMGRADLVQEFRQRAQSTVAKSVAPPPPPIPLSVTEGIRLLQEGKLIEAVEKFQQSTREHPDERSGFGNLGVALARLKRFPEAEQAFRESIRLRPESANMYGNLGASCLDQGKTAEAEEAFRGGIQRDATRRFSSASRQYPGHPRRSCRCCRSLSDSAET